MQSVTGKRNYLATSRDWGRTCVQMGPCPADCSLPPQSLQRCLSPNETHEGRTCHHGIMQPLPERVCQGGQHMPLPTVHKPASGALAHQGHPCSQSALLERNTIQETLPSQAGIWVIILMNLWVTKSNIKWWLQDHHPQWLTHMAEHSKVIQRCPSKSLAVMRYLISTAMLLWHRSGSLCRRPGGWVKWHKSQDFRASFSCSIFICLLDQSS